MTATKNKPALPDHEGEKVSRATIKIVGAGTGMSEGLKIAPIALDTDDTAFFVVRASCVETGHMRDKNGLLVRTHRLRTEDMAPVDADTAQRALQEYAEEVERIKSQVDGQLRLDAEGEAEQAEADDANLPPDEVAAKAAERAKRPPA